MDDDLEKKFEYSIAIVGLSIAIILSTCNLLSKIEITDDFMDFLIMIPQFIIGTFSTSLVYFSIFIVLYGAKLAKDDLLEDKRLKTLGDYRFSAPIIYGNWHI